MKVFKSFVLNALTWVHWANSRNTEKESNVKNKENGTNGALLHVALHVFSDEILRSRAPQRGIFWENPRMEEERSGTEEKAGSHQRTSVGTGKETGQGEQASTPCGLFSNSGYGTKTPHKKLIFLFADERSSSNGCLTSDF